jgi:predicted amidophosphoribosyltransferase
VFVYEGAARELVARIKYRKARSAIGWLARAMGALVVGVEVEIVTWVPTTRAHRGARGFDHAELLARRVGRQLRVPTRRLLDRTTSAPQTGRTLAERWQGPSFRPAAGLRSRPPPRAVLVVDDIVTTGASLAAAAQALRAAGATTVLGVVAARTPPARRPGGARQERSAEAPRSIS